MSFDISNNNNENKQLNNLTLKYFTNKHYINSVNKKINNENNNQYTDNKINNKEIKFYRKRISNFTKKMLREEVEWNDINSNIKDSYYDYVNLLIEYFKINDRCDELQEEFSYLNKDNDNDDNNVINNIKIENINEIILKNKISSSTMDNFVLKTGNRKEDDIKYPQEKTINLTAKHLRIKGIEKNNIEKNKRKSI
tara:strand:- start:4845 stop:5432 length:588 start_codon:yes stop_codon:yes gene_type:complete